MANVANVEVLPIPVLPVANASTPRGVLPPALRATPLSEGGKMGSASHPPGRGHADAICFRYGEARSFGGFEVSGDSKPPKLPGAKARSGKSGPPGGRPLPVCRERRLLDAANLTRIHLGEAEALLAEVPQRRSDEVEFPVVNDEEAIMERLVVVDGELRVLGIEGLDVGVGNLVAWNMVFGAS